MSDDPKIVSLTGGDIPQVGQVSQATIEVLERALEEARSGGIIGVGIVAFHHDRVGSWRLAGMVGGYSMLGAVDVMKSELLDVHRYEQD